MQKAPCKNCTDRFENCHSSCMRYKEWLNDFRNEKKKIMEKREIEVQLDMLQKKNYSSQYKYR